MQAALKLKALILPGKRIEFTAPELPETGEVELIVVLPDSASPLPTEASKSQTEFASAADYLASLEPIQRTPEEWAEVEREFYEERNSWDR